MGVPPGWLQRSREAAVGLCWRKRAEAGLGAGAVDEDEETCPGASLCSAGKGARALSCTRLLHGLSERSQPRSWPADHPQHPHTQHPQPAAPRGAPDICCAAAQWDEGSVLTSMPGFPGGPSGPGAPGSPLAPLRRKWPRCKLERAPPGGARQPEGSEGHGYSPESRGLRASLCHPGEKEEGYKWGLSPRRAGPRSTGCSGPALCLL